MIAYSLGSLDLIRNARFRPYPAWIVFGFVFAIESSAAADGSAVSIATAETLFREGKVLLAEQDYAAACPKLVESQRLDPGTGTLLAVAMCHEGEGKLASAWVEFNQALAEARAAGRADRVNLAVEHISDIEPKLSRLVVYVDDDLVRTAGVQLFWDREPVASVTYGSPIPIDPGEHVISATAPGKVPWTTTVTVGDDARVYEVMVPSLEDAPAPPATDASSHGKAPSSSRTSNGRIAAYALGGAGLVAVGVGSVFGLRALSDSNEAKSQCPDGRCTDPGAIAQNDSAKSSAMVSTVLVVSGAALVVSSAVIWFVLPSKTRLDGVRATVLPGGGAVGYTAAF